jgi:hypothetical protein
MNCMYTNALPSRSSLHEECPQRVPGALRRFARCRPRPTEIPLAPRCNAKQQQANHDEITHAFSTEGDVANGFAVKYFEGQNGPP